MSENPKEEVLDFDEEIKNMEAMLENEFPTILRSKFYLAVKGFIRAKENIAWQNRIIAGTDGVAPVLPAVNPSLTITKKDK